MYTPYVRITNGNPYTVLDAAAKNPLGAVYAPPVTQSLPTTTNGIGAPAVMKYVYIIPQRIRHLWERLRLCTGRIRHSLRCLALSPRVWA